MPTAAQNVVPSVRYTALASRAQYSPLSSMVSGFRNDARESEGLLGPLLGQRGPNCMDEVDNATSVDQGERDPTGLCGRLRCPYVP